VRERPVQMSRRKVLLHNAIVEFSPDTPWSLFLTNIGNAPVHQTKGYVFGTATAYNGQLHVVADEGEPGAVLTIGMDTLGNPTRRPRRAAERRKGSTKDNPHPTRRIRRTLSRRSTGRVSPTPFVVA